MSTNPACIAIDVGYAETKWATFVDGTIRVGSFPSQVGLGDGREDLESGIADAAYRTLSDSARGIPRNEIFVVGPGTDLPSNLIQGFRYSPSHRVLLGHAIRSAGLGNLPVQLATGVPVDEYYAADKAKLEARMHQSLTPTVEHLRTQTPAIGRILRVRVRPQAGAAFMDLVLDDYGQRTDQADSSEWAMVDFGGFTTDLVVGRLGVGFSKRETLPVGALAVIEEASRLVAKHYRARVQELPDMSGILRNPTVLIAGRAVDLSSTISDARRVVGQKIDNFVRKHLGSGLHLSKIVWCGGGAHVFQDVLPNYPHATIADQAEFRNVRGFLKLLMAEQPANV